LNNSFTRYCTGGLDLPDTVPGWVGSVFQDLSLRRKKPQDEVVGTLEREFLTVSPGWNRVGFYGIFDHIWCFNWVLPCVKNLC
jgi:hypothetical protein